MEFIDDDTYRSAFASNAREDVRKLEKRLEDLEKEIERLRQVVRNQNQQISKLKEKEAKRWY